jgi:lipocalin
MRNSAKKNVRFINGYDMNQVVLLNGLLFAITRINSQYKYSLIHAPDQSKYWLAERENLKRAFRLVYKISL